MNIRVAHYLVLSLFVLSLNSMSGPTAHAEPATNRDHGFVGLRPLPRTTEDWNANHGGSWHGLPTFAAQAGNYPYVSEHLDVVKGWLDGDFRTKRMFFEHY